MRRKSQLHKHKKEAKERRVKGEEINFFDSVSVLCFVPTVLMCMWLMCSTRCVFPSQPAQAVKAASYCSRQSQWQSLHVPCPAAPGLGSELLQGHGQQLPNTIPTAHRGLIVLMTLRGYHSDPHRHKLAYKGNTCQVLINQCFVSLLLSFSKTNTVNNVASFLFTSSILLETQLRRQKQSSWLQWINLCFQEPERQQMN